MSTEPGRGTLPRPALAGCIALMVTMGLLASSYGPLLPLLRERFDVTAVDTGWLVSALPAGATIAILLGTRCDVVLGARRLLQIGALLLVAGLVGLALAPTWPLLLVSGLIIGLGYGTATAQANGVIAAAYEPRRAAFLINLQNGLFGVGAILGPICVALLPAGTGRLAWLGYAVLALAAAVLIAAMSRTAESRPPASADDAAPAGTSWRLIGFVAFFACFVAGEIAAAAWATTHLAATGTGATLAALGTSAFYLGLASGRLTAAALGLRIEAGRLVAGTAVVAVAMLVLAYLAPMNGFAYVLVGFAIGPVFPTGLAWVSQDQSSRPHAMGTVLIAGNVGGIALPPLVGAAIAAGGASVAPLPIALTCLLGAVVTVWLVLSRSATGRVGGQDQGSSTALIR